MKHLFVTNKKGSRIVIHRDVLLEAFPSKNGDATVLVVGVESRKGQDPDTFILVSETTEQIEGQLKAMKGCACSDVAMAPAAKSESK